MLTERGRAVTDVDCNVQDSPPRELIARMSAAGSGFDRKFYFNMQYALPRERFVSDVKSRTTLTSLDGAAGSSLEMRSAACGPLGARHVVLDEAVGDADLV